MPISVSINLLYLQWSHKTWHSCQAGLWEHSSLHWGPNPLSWFYQRSKQQVQTNLQYLKQFCAQGIYFNPCSITVHWRYSHSGIQALRSRQAEKQSGNFSLHGLMKNVSNLSKTVWENSKVWKAVLLRISVQCSRFSQFNFKFEYEIDNSLFTSLIQFASDICEISKLFSLEFAILGSKLR